MWKRDKRNPIFLPPSGGASVKAQDTASVLTSLSPNLEEATTMRWLILLFSILFCYVSTEPISICIANCGQCKRMLGPFFKGPACAETCVLTYGLRTPDCNNPNSIKPYLKRLY